MHSTSHNPPTLSNLTLNRFVSSQQPKSRTFDDRRQTTGKKNLPHASNLQSSGLIKMTSRKPQKILSFSCNLIARACIGGFLNRV
jgi:hypothetical protein